MWFAVDTRSFDGHTALHSAAGHGQQAVTKLLLNSGADIEADRHCELTPLMCAMAENQTEIVSLLVTKGAVIRDGRAMAVGAKYSSIAALKALMTSPQWLAMSRTQRLPAEISLLDSVKDTATLQAMRSLVLDMSALVRFQDRVGYNALHAAACYGRAIPLICALIKEGVDPTARNKAGQTPAHVASEAGHTLQATLLERAADDKRKRDLLQQQQQQQQTTE